jgi:non-ribosomal peptide synthetase component F
LIECREQHAEKRKIGNGSASGAGLIHGAIAQHAARRPQATALISNGDHISFAIFDAAARTYAAALARRGVGLGQVIPLVMPRSAQLVALQLAVLQCGAAYANLDPGWPAEQLRTIVDQIAPPVVISTTTGNFSGAITYRPPAEDLRTAAVRCGVRELSRPAAPVDPDAPATVFFTLGTTDGPNGVVVSHRAVTRQFGPGRLAGFGPGHLTPRAAPVPWDMYALELWGQLTGGGTTVIVEGDQLRPAEIEAVVRGLPGIRDCIVVPVTALDGQVTHLALFYLSHPDWIDDDPGDDSDPLSVRAQLVHLLPGYPMPGSVRWLTRFPLTANGELDDAALTELARQSRRGRVSVRPDDSVLTGVAV